MSHRGPLLLAVGGLLLGIHGGWIHAKAALAQRLLERAWQETLAGETSAKPWPWADTWPVARLEVPRMGASMIVLAGGSGRTLAFGPGHTRGTSPPGREGTAVVSGHRDTHFAPLAALRIGDTVVVERPDGARVHYRVERIDVADARRSRLRAPRDDPALLLVTCWPFDAVVPGGPLRWVATARPATDPR